MTFRWKPFFLFCFFLFQSSLFYSQNEVPATPAAERLKAFEVRKQLQQNSIVNEIEFRNVGPTVFSGRVADIDVHPDDPSIFYVAYASGGLWKTENNGTTFQPLFDNEIVITVGDIAVDWTRNIIWLGSGENNSSRSSFAGMGMFKSTDGGKSWAHMGLEESHHIGRIILHPNNPDILWVSVLGHLYSPNSERGVYKSTDGGNTWTRTLFVNENTGGIDLMIDSNNPDLLFASTWQRERRSWNFLESGEGSGVYSSKNGGDSWEKMNTKKSGFPSSEGTGRIGLDLVKSNGKNVMYAVVDNYDRRPMKDKKDKIKDLVKDDLKEMSREVFLKLEDKTLDKFLKTNNFPEKYTAEKVKKMVESGKIEVMALVEYLEDANSMLFDTPVIGAEVYRSDDDGVNWKKTHEGYLDNLYYSYGYYFGQIRVAPQNPDKLFIMGVPILISKDAGKTWKSINQANVHADHHALFVNPNREGHLINGNDGGLNISYDDGENWIKCNSPAVGQFYSVNVDNAKPYNIYGGLQDNGVWVGPSSYKAGSRWHSTGHYPYKELLGGDGMQVAIDSRNNDIVYAGFQFGNYYRISQKTGKRKKITPKHELGERPFRWNWQSPIHLSIHNDDIVYFGSNKLHRSFNKGDAFEEISDDLTKGGRTGDVAFGSLSTIHESPLRFGLLYTGSDDGLIHVSKDGGTTWQNITGTLPENLWVSRVQASSYEESRVYASLNGYRWDNFESHIYLSDDYGSTWKRIGTDLPAEPVNVIKEDPVNENLLYVGTDNGLYISLDRGAHFMAMNNELPAVSVHDVIVHERDKDLVVGTHGRSFYVASVKELQGLNDEVMEKALYAFDLQNVNYNSRWGKKRSMWGEIYEKRIKIPFYSNRQGNMVITIKTADGLTLQTLQYVAVKGLNYVEYDLTIESSRKDKYQEFLNTQNKNGEEIELEKGDSEKFYLKPGEYEVEFFKDNITVKKTLKIVERK